MLPKHILVAGYKIPVVVKPLTNLHGEWDGVTRSISVDAEDSEDTQLSAIAHEILHATFDLSGTKYLIKSEKSEEAIVRSLENLAFPALKTLWKSLK